VLGCCFGIGIVSFFYSNFGAFGFCMHIRFDFVVVVLVVSFVSICVLGCIREFCEFYKQD